MGHVLIAEMRSINALPDSGTRSELDEEQFKHGYTDRFTSRSAVKVPSGAALSIWTSSGIVVRSCSLPWRCRPCSWLLPGTASWAVFVRCSPSLAFSVSGLLKRMFLSGFATV